MKIVAILRIKDQILTIEECLSKLSELVDEIIILDNGSTDGTLEVYPKFDKVKNVLHTVGFDEGRDKIMLLEEAKKTDADWILWVDADEIFEKHFTRKVVEKYMNSGYNRITFRMCNFWLSKTHCRYDGKYYLYTLHPQRSMWRNMPEAYFKNLKIHNGDIMGVPGPIMISPYRIKHFGYVEKKKMEDKRDLYISVDKGGHRDYKNIISPDRPFHSFVFREYKNKQINRIYIMFFKYLCDFLWLVERIRIRTLTLFTLKR